jgi:hypothetical protein
MVETESFNFLLTYERSQPPSDRNGPGGVLVPYTRIDPVGSVYSHSIFGFLRESRVSSIRQVSGIAVSELKASSSTRKLALWTSKPWRVTGSLTLFMPVSFQSSGHFLEYQ